MKDISKSSDNYNPFNYNYNIKADSLFAISLNIILNSLDLIDDY